MGKIVKILLGIVIVLGASIWISNQFKNGSDEAESKLSSEEKLKQLENKLEELGSNPDNNSKKSKGDLLEAVRKEPKVKEAIITDARVLYVSVIDDGTKRDGYASYLCELVREYGSNVNMVKVVKVNSIKDPNRDNAYGVLLGEAYCK